MCSTATSTQNHRVLSIRNFIVEISVVAAKTERRTGKREQRQGSPEARRLFKAGTARDSAILAQPSGRLYGPPCVSWYEIPLPPGFILRCLPMPCHETPSGSAWGTKSSTTAIGSLPDDTAGASGYTLAGVTTGAASTSG